MNYVITDGERFIKKALNGKYSPVGNASLADSFNKKVAVNIWKNSLSKAMQQTYYVAEDDGCEYKRCGFTDGELRRKGYKKKSQGIKFNESNSILNRPHLKKWTSRILGYEDLLKDAAERKGVLKKRLNDIDLALCDLSHSTEKYALNAYEGCMENKLHSFLERKRRDIKDELYIVDLICKNLTDSDKDIMSVINGIKGMETRTYEPRILIELFRGNAKTVFCSENVNTIMKRFAEEDWK